MASGRPAVVVGRVIGFMTDSENSQEDAVSPDLAQLLGRSSATPTDEAALPARG